MDPSVESRRSRSYLILHGIGNERPPQHWEFQLAAELVRAGHDVRYPTLPQPHSPALDEWLAALAAELNALTGEQRNVICHSLACLLWFHAASRGLDAALPVDRVLLVSPPNSAQVPEPGSSLRIVELDAPAVQRSARSELAIVCSDADPYNAPGAQALYGDPLGIRATVIPEAGHITPDSGYGRWRWAEKWCAGAVDPTPEEMTVH
jgi:predicted alpha/beta hydrolase family esterase